MHLSIPAGLILSFLLLTGCSSGPEKQITVVKGKITVSDSIDQSNDFSGIGVTIVKRDSANVDADTLFHALTDSQGTFGGEAQIPEKKEYLGFISRNKRNLGRFGIILAHEDTVTVTAELPDLDQSLKISSHEHDALAAYQRIDRSFRRVIMFARAGRISQDSLDIELNKWSDLYWEVYRKNPETIAGKYAASESIKLLRGWKDRKMMERIDQIENDEQLVELAATHGKDYLAENRGLNYASAYLDTLLELTADPDMQMQIQMEQIDLLYDSARVEAARQKLSAFEEKFADHKEAKSWIENIKYDLNYLSPGDSIPDFSFTENGQTISRDSLRGTPFILEVSRLSNRLYQEQYGRTVAIHGIYKNFGLQIITIPLDTSQVTVDAFFEERVNPWPVADANAFDRSSLIEKFNIQLIPTRFLVDAEGRIIRKYVGGEYKDIIEGLKKISEGEKQPL